METQLTIRLPKYLGVEIQKRAKILRLKKSDVVRMALSNFLKTDLGEPSTPFDKVSHLLGSIQTGISDLGSNHREHLIRKFKSLS